MAEDNYSVKINRRDGAVEITGGDKEWIGAQLDKLAGVFNAEPPAAAGPAAEETKTNGGDGVTPHAPKRRRSRSTGGSSRARGKTKEKSPVFDKLTSEVSKQLEAFMAEREYKGRQKEAAIIATFLEDELEFGGIDQDDLAAVYEVMGWKAPINTRAVINNARDRDKYFQGWAQGRTHLSVAGKNFGRIDSKKKAEAAS